MADSTFRWLQLAAELGGLVVVIYKIGNFTARTEELFKTLFKRQEEFKHDFDTHIKEDHENFKEVNENLVKVQLAAAARKS